LFIALVTAHVKVCHLAYDISKPYGQDRHLCVFCLLKFSVAVCILLVKKLETRQHNDKDWKFKEQHAKMWENIAGAIRYSRPSGFNIAGAGAPVAPAVPTPLVGVVPSEQRCDRRFTHFILVMVFTF